MEYFFIALGLIILLILIIILILLIKFSQKADKSELLNQLTLLDKGFQRQEQQFRSDFKANREELGQNLTNFLEITQNVLRDISNLQQNELKTIAKQNSDGLQQLNKTLQERLSELSEKQEQTNKENREELALRLKEFRESFSQNVKDFNELQKEKFNDLEKKQEELIRSTELKLEKMRETVDEKLQKTLENRLGKSFELVNKQLENVQKGLGEMQNLATDVGGLKRVLSNVKTRGVLGEIQLGNILEQLLAPEQYEENVKTRKSSSFHVEYAIKLPGKDNDRPVYLPIDAKFPMESYEKLLNAYDEGNPETIEEATKQLTNVIKKFAKDISDKYIEPPFTTDFGIMFLPMEGLYAEIVRNSNLIEQLQREFKIIITGPTTLAAILNSFQMGFKTLAIQKRSSEVWEILGKVKTEFNKFGDILVKARKKIDEAGKEIDELSGVRTRAIRRSLRNIESTQVSNTPLLVEGLEEAEDIDIDEL